MCLVPMNVGKPDCTIRKANLGDALEFAPRSLAELLRSLAISRIPPPEATTSMWRIRPATSKYTRMPRVA